MKKCGCIGNPPSSLYHHKTEMPGVPGHHRLSGLGIVSKKRCFMANNESICEGDIIVQRSKNKVMEDTVKGICGDYVITEGSFGVVTQKLAPLKKRLTGAKYEIIKK